ncbi:hypothetical protein [Pleionea sediminis]|nr:hypothetical protein [Pleionea sediminis]
MINTLAKLLKQDPSKLPTSGSDKSIILKRTPDKLLAEKVVHKLDNE